MLVSDHFRKQVQRKTSDFTRNRSLPLTHLIPLMLNYRKGTVQDELDRNHGVRLVDSLKVFQNNIGNHPQHKIYPGDYCHAGYYAEVVLE